MDDPLLVRRIEGIDDLGGDDERVTHREWTAFEATGEGLSVDELVPAP